MSRVRACVSSVACASRVPCADRVRAAREEERRPEGVTNECAECPWECRLSCPERHPTVCVVSGVTCGVARASTWRLGPHWRPVLDLRLRAALE